jgi:hypothetical protein
MTGLPTTNIRRGAPKRTPCPDCKAKTEKQAEKMCKPQRGYDDEYECTGMYMAVDKQGYLTNSKFPTEEDLEQI